MRMIFICCMCKVDMPDIAEKQKKNATVIGDSLWVRKPKTIFRNTRRKHSAVIMMLNETHSEI